MRPRIHTLPATMDFICMQIRAKLNILPRRDNNEAFALPAVMVGYADFDSQ